jgi:hypothetical protein
LARAETEARAAEAELAEAGERLADPAVYADGDVVRDLIGRYNAATDRSTAVAAELTRLTGELEAAEAEGSPVGSPR